LAKFVKHLAEKTYLYEALDENYRLPKGKHAYIKKRYFCWFFVEIGLWSADVQILKSDNGICDENNKHSTVREVAEAAQVLGDAFVFDFDYFYAKESSLCSNTEQHQHLPCQSAFHEEDLQPEWDEIQENEAVELQDEVLLRQSELVIYQQLYAHELRKLSLILLHNMFQIISQF